MSQSETPSAEEQAKFYLNQSISNIGYKDTIESGLGDGPHSEPANDDFDQFVRNLEITFHEGVRHYMQNKREHGAHPENAFLQAVDADTWPDWVVRQIADSEHGLFVSGMEHSKEENEYIAFLENRFDVPL